MSLIKVSEPEWHCSDASADDDILVRRILNISSIKDNDCIPSNVPASSRYPCSDFHITETCILSNIVTTHTIKAALFLSPEITDKIDSEIKSDIIINNHYTDRSRLVPLFISRDSLIWTTGLDYQHTTNPVNLAASTIKLRGIFKFELVFKKCNSNGEYTCFNEEHSRSWELRAKCTHANVVAYRQGDNWI